MISRSAVLYEARSWVGTPYQHQASVKGAGCDCLGLVRGVWRAFCSAEPEQTPPYTPDWAERGGGEALLTGLRRHLDECANASPGDVLLFRMDARSPAKHAAILDQGDALIHAYWGRAVVRSNFAPWWRRRCVGAFSFPGVEPWPS
jgi:NlpC/P60 family putative phage cell wall peptidase